MAAFVVAPSAPSSVPGPGVRLNIFPGSATPAVFAANTPFWIGYGFVAGESDSDDGARSPIEADTGFELAVDGESVPLQTDLRVEGELTIRKFSVASFPSGLPAGWHRLEGRWYDAGALILTSDRSIEFVER